MTSLQTQVCKYVIFKLLALLPFPKKNTHENFGFSKTFADIFQNYFSFSKYVCCVFKNLILLLTLNYEMPFSRHCEPQRSNLSFIIDVEIASLRLAMTQWGTFRNSR